MRLDAQFPVKYSLIIEETILTVRRVGLANAVALFITKVVTTALFVIAIISLMFLFMCLSGFKAR